MDCKMQCLFVSISGGVFLFFLGFLCAVGSQTLYIPINHRLASSVALFFSSFIYLGIFIYLYNDIYIKNQRKNNIQQWIDARRTVVHKEGIELRDIQQHQSSKVRFVDQ